MQGSPQVLLTEGLVIRSSPSAPPHDPKTAELGPGDVGWAASPALPGTGTT